MVGFAKPSFNQSTVASGLAGSAGGSWTMGKNKIEAGETATINDGHYLLGFGKFSIEGSLEVLGTGQLIILDSIL